MICRREHRLLKDVLFFLALGIGVSIPCLGAQSRGIADAGPFGRVIREIRFRGLHNVREDVVRDQLDSRAGQLYTEEAARNDTRGLDRLGVFSSIRITPSLVESDVILDVEVQEIVRILPFPSVAM